VAMSGLSGTVTPLSLTPGMVAAKVGLGR
jgi:hypothetical protein